MYITNVQKIPMGQSTMDNQEKLVTQGTPDGKKHNKNNPEKLVTQGTPDGKKHNTICVGHHYKQANTINVNKI